jgi:hypothetical protein
MISHKYPIGIKVQINMRQRGLKFPTSQHFLPIFSDNITNNAEMT